MKKIKIPRYPSLPKEVKNGIRINTFFAKWGQRLGSSICATAYRHPTNPNWVLKVYTDRAYHDYYTEICSKHKNPHFPKGLKPKLVIQTEHSKTYMVYLEYLPLELRLSNKVSTAYWKYSDNPNNIKHPGTKNLFEEFPRLKSAFRLINTLHHAKDLGGENIRSRNGIPVITDPVV